MNPYQTIIELRKALEEIQNVPFVTPEAYHIASKALLATKEKTIWITNDGV